MCGATSSGAACGGRSRRPPRRPRAARRARACAIRVSVPYSLLASGVFQQLQGTAAAPGRQDPWHHAGMASGEDTARLLGRVPLFAELSERDLAELAQVAVPRSWLAGEAVFREGDSGDTC